MNDIQDFSPTSTTESFAMSTRHSMNSGPLNKRPRSSTMSSISSTHTRKSSDDFVNYYGRHSDDWLFGGFSLWDAVKDGMDKLRHLRDD